MSHQYWANFLTWTCTWEPAPVLGALDINRSLVWDPYLGTWTRTWEPVLGNPYSFMYSKVGPISVTHMVVFSLINSCLVYLGDIVLVILF